MTGWRPLVLLLVCAVVIWHDRRRFWQRSTLVITAAVVVGTLVVWAVVR